MANEFIILVDNLNKAILDDRNMRVALTTTLAEHKPRIFEKGLDAKGGQIGVYSTNPISISKSRQAKNTGQTYFPGGYAEYHGKIGKGKSKVILRDTDQMYFDYGLQGSAGNYGFGFQNALNGEKSVWMEEKYKKEIFELSDKELDTFGTVLNAQISK